MGYDSVKHHGGRAYTGMRVDAGHRWRYEGTWRETKTSPEEWRLTFEATKRRLRAAPPNTACPVGTAYHWLVVGSQFATKVDANAYDTFLAGVKWKVGEMPLEGSWSYERAGAKGAQARVIDHLEELAATLREGPGGHEAAPRLVLGEAHRPVPTGVPRQAKLVEGA